MEGTKRDHHRTDHVWWSGETFHIYILYYVLKSGCGKLHLKISFRLQLVSPDKLNWIMGSCLYSTYYTTDGTFTVRENCPAIHLPSSRRLFYRFSFGPNKITSCSLPVSHSDIQQIFQATIYNVGDGPFIAQQWHCHGNICGSHIPQCDCWAEYQSSNHKNPANSSAVISNKFNKISFVWW